MMPYFSLNYHAISPIVLTGNDARFDKLSLKSYSPTNYFTGSTL